MRTQDQRACLDEMGTHLTTQKVASHGGSMYIGGAGHIFLI